jgi:CheY-like chemotaxis protein
MTNIQILIVEDDHDYLFMLAEMFRKRFKVQVQMASSVDAAESLLETTDFDMVISDIQMPGRNGIEVLRILLRLNKSVPLIFFTASDISQRDLDQHGYPCVVVNKKDHRDLLQIASEFLSKPLKG